MQPGSIVECIDDKPIPAPVLIIFPSRKKLYMVREILPGSLTTNGERGIYLEEIHNEEIPCELKTGTFIMEPSFRESRFKEIKINSSELFNILDETNLISIRNS